VQGAAKAASRQETGDIRPVDHGADTGCHQFRLQANSKLTGTETVNENAHRDATPGGAGHGCGDGTTRRVILEDVAFEMDLMPGFVDRLEASLIALISAVCTPNRSVELNERM